MGSVQVITTIIKFVALAFMSTVGLFYISGANFTPWNLSGESAISAIGGGMAIALFSLRGWPLPRLPMGATSPGSGR
jgi:basic amino acid/polyamine antiporter, APA family